MSTANAALSTPASPTFAELAKGNFQEVTETAIVRDLEYLQQLALQTGTDISGWPALNLLTPEVRGNKRAINKVFFAKIEEVKTPVLDETNPTVMETLKIAELHGGKAFIERKITELESSRVYALAAARDYARETQNKVKEAYELRVHVEQLKGNPPSILDDVRKILSNPFWELRINNAPTIYLLTRNEVICCERSPSMGVDRKVNLGTFEIRLNLQRMSLVVQPYSNNLKAAGHFHPYIGAGGDICWGNAADSVAKMLHNGEVAKVMDLLISLLTNYASDSTPYIRLMEFENLRKAGLSDSAEQRDNNSCSVCENHVDDCECYSCDFCGERGTEPCERHYCSICSQYSRRPEECCCHTCEVSMEDCEACGECGSHGDHVSSCAHHPDNEETEE